MKITNKMREKYPVLNTRLYETLAAVLPKNRHRKLRDNLQLVWDQRRPWSIDNTAIEAAFTWRATPQGYDFWRELACYQCYGWKQGRKMWLEARME